MSSMSALRDGLIVMVIGMGIVFAFLTLMVFAVEIMHIIIEFLNKIFPPEAEVEVKKVKTVASDDEMVAIAIAASKI